MQAGDGCGIVTTGTDETGTQMGKQKMRAGAALVAITLTLGACGSKAPPSYVPPTAPAMTTSGPLGTACLNSGRPGVSRERCGCIQMAANQTLSPPEQFLGAAFFDDPAKAHDVRLSDTARDDAFWERWTAFGKTAETLCRSA